jgi:DNA (cytosine-5)-methyltransferase 1
VKKLTLGSLFSGIGGLELGFERTGGFETRWQVENDAYATKVLEKHWPTVRRYGDITKLDATELERVDVIVGGFPCQDVSVAGKRAGLAGARSGLWSEYIRIVRALRPRYVVVENVPGLFVRGFSQVLGDLAGGGYDAEWQVLSAAAFGAPHIRERVFIIAYAQGDLRRASRDERSPASNRCRALLADPKSAGTATTQLPGQRGGFIDSGEALAYSSIERRKRAGTTWAGRDGLTDGGSDVAHTPRQQDRWVCKPRVFTDARTEGDGHTARLLRSAADWWAVEPNVGRVANGVPSRVDRLRCLGNAVVPQVAQYVAECILTHEAML